MTDLSNGDICVARRRSHSWGSFKTALWMQYLLLWRLRGLDPTSTELELVDGTYVSMPNSFETDGTTFVITYDNGDVRRVPASRVVGPTANGDYGYAT